MRVLVIGNPISGGGRAPRLANSLRDSLTASGHETELFFTSRTGDARHRAAGLGSVDRLVVVGGDGTLNEVLNGLEDPSRVPMTQLATGTANILAHELGLPRRPEAVAALVHEGRVRRIDMGLVGERRFLMVASAGFDAAVTREIALRRTSTLGYAAYLGPILRVLRVYREPRIEVGVDGASPVTGGMVVVSNTRNYGGLFTVADRARCDSGHLDACVLEDATLRGLIRAAWWAWTGGMSGRSGVSYLTGRRITIGSREPVAVEVDGDYFGTTPVEIEVEPAVVPMLVPSQAG